MERVLDVRTGEAIALRYDLAGLGSRFLAVAIDLTIQLSVAIGTILLFGAFSVPIGAALAPLGARKFGSAIIIALFSIATFLLFFGYFIIFELAWNGRTPGKRLMRLRVVRDAGFPIDLGAAVIRNLVRAIEFSLGFYAISAIVTLVSTQNKRIGDYAAGTIVVRERPLERGFLERYQKDDPRRDLAGPHERALIEAYFARSGSLDRAARHAVAARLAARIRPNVSPELATLDDLALLEHLRNER